MVGGAKPFGALVDSYCGQNVWFIPCCRASVPSGARVFATVKGGGIKIASPK